MEPTYYVILNFSYSEYLGSEDERARISNLFISFFTLFLYLYPRSNITQTILNLEGSTLTCFRKEGYIWVKMRAKSGLKWNNCAIRKYSIIVCRRGAIKLPNIITAGCKSIASQGFIHLLKFTTDEAYLEYYVMSIVWSILLLKIG